MSQIGNTLDKSDSDLSYSDLKNLFKLSDVEPIENYGKQIKKFGKNFNDYGKLMGKERNESYVRMKDLRRRERHKTRRKRSIFIYDNDIDPDNESVISQNSYYVSEKSTNCTKSNDDGQQCSAKVLYQSPRFFVNPENDNELLTFDDGNDADDNDSDDDEHCDYHVVYQNCDVEVDDGDDDDDNGDRICVCSPSNPKMLEGGGEGLYEPTRSGTKDNFLSGLCAQLSLTSSYQQHVVEILEKERSVYDIVDLDDCLYEWNNDIDAKKRHLERYLSHDLDEHMNLSAWIYFGRVRFRCHKLVLRSCRLFREWDEKHYVFRPEHRLTAMAFNIFYTFATGQRPEIPAHHLLDVRQVARKFGAPDLAAYCMELLDSSEYQEDDAFHIFKAAKNHRLPIIQQLVLQRIFKFFLPLVASKDFVELDTDDVCQLLASNTIGVNSEIEVFFAAILWLNYKWPERNEKIINRVMSCVRYALIPPWFNYSLKKSTGFVEVDRIVKQKGVKKMIENGASIAATISLYFLDKAKFEPILKRLQIKIPKQRHWIYDRNCTYHYGAHEIVTDAIDYIVFKNYLKLLDVEGKYYWSQLHEGRETHFGQIFCQKFLDTAWSKIDF